MLTRAEAGALADQVQSAAVDDRAGKVAGLQDLYGPLFGRAMKELSNEGLDPRHRALAWARRAASPPPTSNTGKDQKKAVPRGTRPKFGEETKYFMFSWPRGSITFTLLKFT